MIHFHRMRRAAAWAVLVVAIGGEASGAESFPIQGRLFLANTFISPSELNAEMSAQGLSRFKGLPELGVEITYPLARFLDVGLRYSRKGATEYQAGSTTSTPFRGDLRQDTALLIARVPVVRTSLLKFDVFAGVGGSNTSFEMKSAVENGQLTKKASSDAWFASPAWSGGGSVGMGYQKFFVYVEGGYSHSNPGSLARTGNLSGSVNTLDLSGPYVMLGVLFDGISGTKK